MKRISLIVFFIFLLLTACNIKNEAVVESTTKVETTKKVEKDDDTETAKLFKTKTGEYFDLYRLKQVIEKDTGKKCKTSDFVATDDIIKHNDAFDKNLQTYECDVFTDSWANGKWQLQKHYDEKIDKNPKNGYAFPLYIDENLETKGTILAWKVDTEIIDYVDDIDFKNLDNLIPKKEDIDKDGVEDKLWKDLVNNTKYKNIPKDQENDFEVKKYIVVEYIYESRINGINTIPYIEKCEAVKEFLLKKIYRNQ